MHKAVFTCRSLSYGNRSINTYPFSDNKNHYQLQIQNHPICTEHLTAECYDIQNVCVYRLSDLNLLIPCETGLHLQECEHFECNLNFKCQRYYCIP